jgi:hypothetical protein
MPLTGSNLAQECPKCLVPLIRIIRSESNDVVVCPICWCSGDYKEVIEAGRSLVDGIVIEPDARDFVLRLRYGHR